MHLPSSSCSCSCSGSVVVCMVYYYGIILLLAVWAVKAVVAIIEVDAVVLVATGKRCQTSETERFVKLVISRNLGPFRCLTMFWIHLSYL